MRMGDKETVGLVVSWWRGLQPDPLNLRKGNRAALACLRRCTNVTEALFEVETQTLLRQCGATRDAELSRLALAAAVLAHVRIERPGEPFARQIGPVFKADTATALDPETALCKPARFRRVLDAESYDECLRVFRRLVALAGAALNVTDLTYALLLWPREGAQDVLAGDRVRRLWVYNYWNAGTPETVFNKKEQI